jgi:hypothetical protein
MASNQMVCGAHRCGSEARTDDDDFEFPEPCDSLTHGDLAASARRVGRAELAPPLQFELASAQLRFRLPTGERGRATLLD